MWKKISIWEKAEFLTDLTKSYLLGGTSGFNDSLATWEDTSQIYRDKLLMEKVNRIRQRVAHLE